MKIKQFAHKFFFLFVFLPFVSVYLLADPASTGAQFSGAHTANAQTIPAIDLSELDFRIEIDATAVAPGEIILFRLAVTNTTDLPLDPIAFVTMPPSNTTFSAAQSSSGWIQSGTESIPCADGHPAGFTCYFLIDALQAGEAIEAVFAVKIDSDLPLGSERISLTANIYPADQQPLAPNIPPPIAGQQDPPANPAAILDHAIFLPLFN